jgi:hypothetical protein
MVHHLLELYQCKVPCAGWRLMLRLAGTVHHHQMKNVNGERLEIVAGVIAGVNVGDMLGI